jgi:hypothetical protein
MIRHLEPWYGEPWHTEGGDDDYSVHIDIYPVDRGYCIADRIDMDDARRIVACVNACAGISTEELEAMTPYEIVTVLKGVKDDQ